MNVNGLDAALAAAGLKLGGDALDKLCAYAALLVEQNRTMNLIGPATEGDIANRHFVDSLAPLMYKPLLPDSNTDSPSNANPTANIFFGEIAGKSLIDVGSGAGFPGMVLAIALPRLRVTLCDSLGKRCGFLAGCVRELGLDNVEVLNARAEELGHTHRRESFDFAAARAVTAMSALCELCLPLIKVGGTMLAYKTARASDEIAAAAPAVKALGGAMLSPYCYTIPDAGGGGMAMRLQPVRKVSPTPHGYPRSWGKIKAKPL